MGIDDGKFTFHSKEQVPVIGVVFRGGNWFDGVMSSQVTVDGFDATENIGYMIINSTHFGQLRVVMLNGITFGGFNVVDIKVLNEMTGLPVIVVSERKPNLEKIHLAIQHLPRSEERLRAILNAGEISPVATRGANKRIFVETIGISKDLAVEVLKLTSTRSKIPEPLRVAHLIASGISLNRSVSVDYGKVKKT